MDSHVPFTFQQLDVYVASKAIARVVHGLDIADAELRDQARRASKSVFLNVAEGLPSFSAGTRKRHFTIARGSLAEIVAALDLARELGCVEANGASAVMRIAASVAAMLTKLVR